VARVKIVPARLAVPSTVLLDQHTLPPEGEKWARLGARGRQGPSAFRAERTARPAVQPDQWRRLADWKGRGPDHHAVWGWWPGPYSPGWGPRGEHIQHLAKAMSRQLYFGAGRPSRGQKNGGV